MLSLTVWMNMPSFYQGDVFRALVNSGEVELQVVFANDLSEDRLELGWETDLSGYPYRFLDKDRPILDAVRLAWTQRDRLHIVNGLWAEPAFAAALTLFAAVGSDYLIYSEAPNPFVSRSLSRRMLRAAFGKLIARRARSALPISHLASEFLKSLGVHEELMYPFGYFRARALVGKAVSLKTKNKIEVVFVGQIVHRKGLDLLLEAMRPLFEKHKHLILSVIGTGEKEVCFQEQVDDLGLTERVLFEGTTPYDQILDRLATADVLVLPSRWDGWGLVVNEAFAVGLPVIVSDQCGVADLVRNDINGYVFRSGDASSLRASLSAFIDKKADWGQLRAQSRATGETISAESVAPYLIECLRHLKGMTTERPLPPWHSTLEPAAS
jgi:glycosyltransferase involved in cell wall biosynthesis